MNMVLVSVSRLKFTGVLFVLCGCLVSRAQTPTPIPPPELNWRYDTYESETPVIGNPFKDAKLTVSGQFSHFGPEFVIDGNTGTGKYWACEELPATLTIEMERAVPLQTGRIWFYYGKPRVYKFFIETSQDGEQWVMVADWRENQLPSSDQGFSVPFNQPVTAKHIRITVTDSSVRSAGAHIVEFFVSNTSSVVMGFSGCNVGFERITAANAIRENGNQKWQATAWRNERVHGQFVVWSLSEAVPQLRLACSELRSSGGHTIPQEAMDTRFVRYVLARGQSVGDILDTAEQVDMPPGGFRPVWLTVNVPDQTPPGVYSGELKVIGKGGLQVVFPLELEVLPPSLPMPDKWAFFLDLWQHPWAVARYHGVKPFSPEHYSLLTPIYQELARAGQKTLTVTLIEKPWGHQNFDPYRTMIKRIRNADGTWSFDYTLLDEYVKFGRSCGIGPNIHCYSITPWGQPTYIDSTTGDEIAVHIKPGTQEYEEFWAPFLQDFEKHMQQQGWIKDTYIAMDEIAPDMVRATVACLKKFAPSLKVAMAGNKPPSHFKGVDLPNYCQYIAHIDDQFLQEAVERRNKGEVTTFYVCCGPGRPNTFVNSPPAEPVWLGLYAIANGLDGFLRWSFVNWPRDPLFDASFNHWTPGDTFLLYPGPRSSIRWEMLRDGIEESEKVRWLRQHNRSSAELESVLKEFVFQKAVKAKDDEIRDVVERTRAAIEKAARSIPGLK